jgi:hypothetical protein
MVDALLSHRSSAGQFGAVVVVIVAVLGLLSALLQGFSGIGFVVVPIMAVCVAYLLGLRPVVHETAAGLEIRNPFRTVEVPWAAVTDAFFNDVLVIEAGAVTVRCFAVPKPSWRNRSGGSTFMGGVAGRLRDPELPDPAMGRSNAADRIRDLAARFALGRSGTTDIGQRWAPDALAAAGLGVAALVVGMAAWLM